MPNVLHILTFRVDLNALQVFYGHPKTQALEDAALLFAGSVFTSQLHNLSTSPQRFNSEGSSVTHPPTAFSQYGKENGNTSSQYGKETEQRIQKSGEAVQTAVQTDQGMT
ncbi:hypothetical protein PtA15_2A292 [Puccinia triticina]|uniref:Uncharacterized protein n=1 Tax=Puccinia triticina TaxID=208348 RepID=A0ABY7CAB0_9BASI|nr:uncharacterized protein PtA15_2A292 [Puccinia triticina]WAQ81979.1 hypothetical protein PtA15_2A292 [Puccinia triticina]